VEDPHNYNVWLLESNIENKMNFERGDTFRKTSLQYKAQIGWDFAFEGHIFNVKSDIV
jgi:hypothetical protein